MSDAIGAAPVSSPFEASTIAVGLPVTLAAVGAGAGGLVLPGKRVEGMMIGAIVGLIIGVVADQKIAEETLTDGT